MFVQHYLVRTINGLCWSFRCSDKGVLAMRYFFLSLALIVGFAQSQEVKKPIPPIKNEAKGTDKSNNNANSKQTISIEFPSSVNVSVGGKLDIKSSRDEPKKHEEPTNYAEWLISGFTGLLVVVTAALASYTALLWGSTKRLMEGAEDTARRQLRAYVAFEAAYRRTDGNNWDGGGHTLKVRVKNYGDTPAHEMTIWFKFVEFKPPDVGFNPTYLPTDKISEPQMLHPTQEFNLIATTSYVFTGEVNRARGDDMGDNYIFGRIVYRDIFDNWWSTCFCYEYEGGERFRPHGDYNKEENYGKKCPV
jgi:hypothetical protein